MSEKKQDANGSPSVMKRVGRMTWKIFKWPVLLAIPALVFGFSAWWSLVGTLSSDIVSVPDVRGKTVEEARFLFASRRLETTVSDITRHSQEIDVGLIVETDPPMGARIKKGRNINLILSSGFERKMVPALYLKSVTEAELLGRQFGFRIVGKDYSFSESVPVGHIIAQTPEAHTAFVSDSVSILVSRGPRSQLAILPNLVNKPLLPILEDLKASGFSVIVRSRGNSADISNNDPFELRRYRIYRQIPTAGTFINARSPEPIILRVEWQ